MKPIWTLPTLVAHRGGGQLAPENTLAGMQAAVDHGFNAVEFDVKLSRDTVPFLLHDDDLARTTNGDGLAKGLNWPDLSRLDAGSWFAADFASERVPSLDEVVAFCLAHALQMNIELKPCLGEERATGRAVAKKVGAHWHTPALRGQPLPLLSSFSVVALQAAQEAAPEVPRGLLIETWPDDVLALLHELGCVSLHAEASLWTRARIKAVRDAGFKVLAWTVNDVAQAQQLLAWGAHAVVTDALDQRRAMLGQLASASVG
ncbi:MAG: glycerophosphodiester phosphodiesterase [Neisseriaceae bacterium]|nr:glycerophosphodiester phosphodiesterase [Neisseriaceae bacterium]MBP6863020.1 glycerophosphodiester phosphodiesterase [Neisseriaceae bacterium]